MKRLLALVLSFLCFAPVYIFAQNSCGTDEMMRREYAKNPALKEQRAAFEEQIKAFITANRSLEKANERLIIPVVFHIIHEGGSENISKAQVLNQVDILNQDFNLNNADFSNAPAPFAAIAGNLNVEFRLAKKDPAGNCTDGIVRVYSPHTNNAGEEVKALSYWNSYSYLNVWVIKSFPEPGLGGYAYLPGSVLASVDGIIIKHNLIGSTGTSSSGAKHTLTHEVGHWLNLMHTFGEGNGDAEDAPCSTDHVDDTPPQYGTQFGVCYTSFPYVPNPHCVGLDTLTGEMMVNYMTYTNGGCTNMFTEGQVERMRYTLEGPHGDDGIKTYLCTEENLWQTGTHDDYTAQACAPIADFIANRTLICDHQNITFSDVSYNASVTGRNWSFPGGTPASSTASAPVVSYDAPGTYEVTLEVSNSDGSGSKTKTGYIKILPSATEETAAFTYLGDFENADDFNAKWSVVNPDNSAHKWEIAGGLYTPSGGGALRVNNRFNDLKEYEELVSPSYNLSGLQDPLVLSYKYSGATLTALGEENAGDNFKVYFSTNCGQTWTQINQLALSGASLMNAGQYSDFYVPGPYSIWSDKSTTLSSAAANSDNVRFKLRYEVGSGYGNNFYLDAFRIENVTGTHDLNEFLAVNVFPDPTEGLTTLSLNAPEKGTLSVKLFDVSGREVSAVYNGSVSPGKVSVDFDVKGIDAGIYVLKIVYNERSSGLKLIVR